MRIRKGYASGVRMRSPATIPSLDGYALFTSGKFFFTVFPGPALLLTFRLQNVSFRQERSYDGRFRLRHPNKSAVAGKWVIN